MPTLTYYVCSNCKKYFEYNGYYDKDGKWVSGRCPYCGGTLHAEQVTENY